MQRATGAGLTLEACIARYGEDNGKYLYETLYAYKDHYSRLIYLQSAADPDAQFREQAANEAALSGWDFHTWAASLEWIHDLVSGPWPADRFLTVPPGGLIKGRHDGSLIGIGEVRG
jgi:hypothetical protein